MAVRIAPVVRQQFFDNQGRVAAGMKVFTYAAGTTNKLATYTSSTGGTPNANPIVLDSAGRTPSGFWLTDGSLYKLVLAPANDTDPPASPVWTEDNVQSGEATLSSLISTSVSLGDALVTVKLVATASATRTQHQKNADVIHVEDFAVVGDGVTDDTTAVAAAIAALPSNGVLLFKPGRNYKISTISCDGKPMTLWCYGATITFTSSSGAFSKTDHGNKLTVLGGTFVASGAGAIAIKYNATPTVNTYDDFLIRDCDFTNATGAYAISLVGPREGNIQRCSFRGNATGGGGVYMQAAVSPFIESCQFLGGTAGKGVFYDGTGTGYDAGLILHNCEIMGWDTGVDIRYCDWLNINGCTVDYNQTDGIVLYSQDGAQITGNYLGSPNANPAVRLSKGVLGVVPDGNSKITIAHNHLTGHYTGGNTYDCILINDTGNLSIDISHNHVAFYTRYGINFLTTADMLIEGNTFAPRSTFGVLPIYNSTAAGDAAVRIQNNRFPAGTSFAGSGLTFCLMRDNSGYATNAVGSYITSGAGTAYAIPHGMPSTPDNIQLAALAAGDRPLWVTSVDATNINVATSGVFAAFTIYWSATKRIGF